MYLNKWGRWKESKLIGRLLWELKRCQKNKVKARSLFCYWAVKEEGISLIKDKNVHKIGEQ